MTFYNCISRRNQVSVHIIMRDFLEKGAITHLGILCRSYEMINMEVHLEDDMGLKDYMWLNLRNFHLEC